MKEPISFFIGMLIINGLLVESFGRNVFFIIELFLFNCLMICIMEPNLFIKGGKG